MNVIVCGGRDFESRQAVYDFLDLTIDVDEDWLIHGACPTGVDKYVDDWCTQTGCGVSAFAADWDHYGRAAGPIRNTLMLDAGNPDVVVAFPGGRGTRNMVEQATNRGLHIVNIDRLEALEDGSISEPEESNDAASGNA